VNESSPHWALHFPSPHTHGCLQSCGQVSFDSPHWGWQTAFPHWHGSGQSGWQVFTVSPHWGWHAPSPHAHGAAQSMQVWADSPHSGWQIPSPQNTPGPHTPQSKGHVFTLSHVKSHTPSPHRHVELQSDGQVAGVSPHSGSQNKFPHACGQ